MASSSSLRREKAKKEKERDTLIKRKAGVDSINQNMSSRLEGYITDVNTMMMTCSQNLHNGLDGKRSDIETAIEGEKESYVGSDAKLSSSSEKLSDESSRCQKEIERLNSEIAQLEIEIREAERREEEARQAALRELLAKATGALEKK